MATRAYQSQTSSLSQLSGVAVTPAGSFQLERRELGEGIILIGHLHAVLVVDPGLRATRATIIAPGAAVTIITARAAILTAATTTTTRAAGLAEGAARGAGLGVAVVVAVITARLALGARGVGTGRGVGLGDGLGW